MLGDLGADHELAQDLAGFHSPPIDADNYPPDEDEDARERRLNAIKLSPAERQARLDSMSAVVAARGAAKRAAKLAATQ